MTRASDFGGSLRRLLARMSGQRPLLSAIAAFAVLSVAAAVIGPKVLARATDLIFAGVLGAQLPGGLSKAQAVAGLRTQGQDQVADLVAATDLVPGQGIDLGAVGQVALWALAIFLVASVLAWVQGRLTTVVVQRTVFALRADVESKMHRLPLAYLDRQSRGEVLSRVTNDVDNVAQSLQQTMSQLVTSVLTVVGVLAMMLYVSPLLAVVALVTIPVSTALTVVIGKRAQPLFAQQWATTGKLNAHVEEMYTGHELVKVFGRQQQAADGFAEHNESLFRTSFKAQFVAGLIQPVMFFISNVNYVVVAVVGAVQVASGSISLGDVQAVIQYSRQLGQPLGQLASMANLLQSGVASAERVFELLDEPEESVDVLPAAGGVGSPAGVRGRVAFEDVSFAYDPQRPLIEHLDLLAEPGQTIAIVGPTGAGKTTLANLLLRFYDVDGGRITLDGVDIRDMPRRELRGDFGVVLQDAWLFGGSIRDNIAYGAEVVTEAELEQAAQAASVDHFVRTLPDGYDTELDEEGAGVSAGQRQLLTIARAFVSDPAVLILDEATSSVDTRTERLVQDAMAALRVGRTSFVIAHRLSTIRDADRIVVMEEGAIVEQGNHEELLARDGPYARLYAAQFSAAFDDGVQDILQTAAVGGG